MTTFTQHFSFTKLGPSEGVHASPDRYAAADRELMDTLHYQHATHRHTGEEGEQAPESGPELTLATTGGLMRSGTTFNYRYTLVHPSIGESPASPMVSVTTPPALPAPEAPTFSTQAIGGTLPPGQFFYVLTHYVGQSTVETKALNPVSVQVPAGSDSNEITLNLPALPAAATGFNVYRRAPNQTRYYYVGSVTTNEFVDNGTISVSGGITVTYDGTAATNETPNRTLPPENTTGSTNSVAVGLPSTATIPAGGFWRIYRSTTPDFTDSFLIELDENTFEYNDIGNGTTQGSPPVRVGFGSPGKIDLTDGAEVQGTLPMSMVAFPHVVTFQMPGTLAVANGEGVWMCEFPYAEIVAVRATLGRGSVPHVDDVIVDVDKGTATATPTYTSIFTSTPKPRVLVGEQIGARVVPDTVTVEQGESLTINVEQTGGGDQTDENLLVTVSMIIYGYPNESFLPVTEPTVDYGF